MSRWWKMPRQGDSEWTNILSWGANDRTNIFLQSGDFDTTWTKSNTTAGTDTIAPDGSTTGWQLLDNSATGTGALQVYQSVTVATATAYCVSVFAKADQLSKMSFSLDSFTTPVLSATYFDLSDGTVDTLNAAHDNAGVEAYENGWYRCWLTFTTDATDTSGVIAIRASEDTIGGTVNLDGTSSIYIWGAQFETGTSPTPYISTTTGARTITGITLKNNFIDDVHACLENITEDTGSLDDLYKKYKRGH